MTRIFASLAFLLTLSIVSISAQTPTPTPPAADDKDPVVITTNLIQVDATIYDKKGSIVKDLTADDFEIYENGRKQQITNFSFVELQPEKAAQPPNTAEKGKKPFPNQPPVFKNLRPEQVARTVALIVDDLRLSFSGIDSVRSALKRFVDEQMQPADDNFEDIDQRGGFTKIENALVSRSTELFETQQGLRVLAAETGGFAMLNNNNLGKGLDRVMNDQRGYYLIGYQPDNETFDPRKARFNKLTVRLKHPDLQIRYRSGFFGIKDEEIKTQPKTAQGQILAALTSPLNSGDIDLQLTSLFAHDPQTGDFMRSLLYVDGNDLQFTEDSNGWEKATFDVVAMTLGGNGEIVDVISRTETIKARAETLKEIREKGFVANITVPIKKPGAYQMRVGSASQFIEIPNLNKERLALSGLLLQRVETPARSDSAQKAFQSNAERDLAVRSFPAGETVRFGYAIYNAQSDKQTKAPNLTMQYRIFRDGKETFVSREKNVKILEQPDAERILSEGFFSLGRRTPPGDYVLQVIVRNAAGGEKNQIAVQWIDFEVVN